MWWPFTFIEIKQIFFTTIDIIFWKSVLMQSVSAPTHFYTSFLYIKYICSKEERESTLTKHSLCCLIDKIWQEIVIQTRPFSLQSALHINTPEQLLTDELLNYRRKTALVLHRNWNIHYNLESLTSNLPWALKRNRNAWETEMCVLWPRGPCLSYREKKRHVFSDKEETLGRAEMQQRSPSFEKMPIC